MNRKTQIAVMTLCMVLLLAWGGLGTAQADSVGFNIYNWYQVYPGEIAGFTDVAQTNWNNYWTGNWFPTAGSLTNLQNSNGDIMTGLTVSWTAPNNGWFQQGQAGYGTHYPAGPPGTNSDGNMYYGYMESNSSTPVVFTVKSIPYTQYDIYVYMNRDAVATETDGVIKIGGTRYYYHPIVGWNGTFTRATTTAQPDPIGSAPEANYVKFTGLTGPAQKIEALTITTLPTSDNGSGKGGAICAFQIVNTGGPPAVVPNITLGPPSVLTTVTGPVDYLTTYTGATTMALTPAKVSLLPSEGTVSGTVEILNPTSANPTIRVKDLTGFGKLRITILAGSASNVTGPAAAVGPSVVVSVYPPLANPPLAPATGSKLWWDAQNVNGSNNSGLADGANITTWKDKSGNGNDGLAIGVGPVIQKALPALGGKATVQFPGVKADGTMDFTTPLTDVRSVFWVTQVDPTNINSGDGAYDPLLGTYVGTPAGAIGYDWHANTNRILGNPWCNTNIASTTPGVQWRLLGEVFDANAVDVAPYGHTIVSVDTAGDMPAAYFAGDGRTDYTTTRQFHGYLTELIIYNRLLTADERNTTGRYLANKYGKNTAYGYPDAPRVTLVYPTGTSSSVLNTPVDLIATAVAGVGNSIAAMEFYVDWQLAGTVTAPNAQGQYVFTWTTPGTAGSHEVFARALDDNTPALAAMSAIGTITAMAPMFVTTTGTGSGASWADAASMAKAFSIGEGGSIIYMKAGTYNLIEQLSPSVYVSSLAVYGGFAGTEASPAQRTGTPGVDNETKLDAGNTVLGVIANGGLNLVLDRLTITRAKSSAVSLPAATNMIKNCKFLSNYAPGNGGGAIFASGGTMTAEDCWFEGNIANTAAATRGGAIYALYGRMNLTRCTFKNNQSGTGHGGGVRTTGGNVNTIDSCWFEGNTTAGRGGGLQIYCQPGSPSIVTNCVFLNNTSGTEGGGVCLDEPPAVFMNNTVVGNNSTGGAVADVDGLYVHHSNSYTTYQKIVNNIFKGQTGLAIAAQNASWAAGVTATNNLFDTTGNTVQAEVVQVGSIRAAPGFTNETGKDFSLAAGSAGIDAGYALVFTNNDASTYGNYQYPARDYAGKLRFDTKPDIGAYEVPVMGQIGITPSPLSFGVVLETESSTKTLTLTNTGGNENVTVTAITPAGSGFSLHGVTTPITILAGESAEVEVVFTAPVVGVRTSYAGTVTVTSDATNSPTTGQLRAIGALSYFPGVPPTVLVERSAGTPATTNVFPIEFTITFSEGVTGFELGDIRWDGLVKATNVTATLIPREATGAQYTLQITNITGVGAGGTVNPVVPEKVAETIARNGNLVSNTDAVVNYDANLFGAKIATTSAAITDATTVTCTVTFDAAIKGDGALALVESKLALTGTSGGTIAHVLQTNPSTAYTVEITTGGDGTLALTLNDDDAILKASTDAPLNGTGASVIYGPMVEVDKTSPTLVSIQRAFGAARGTNDTTVVFKVTFSDIVTGVDAADFTVTCSDATADVASVTTIGNTAYVVCNVKTAIGPYALSVKTAATMTNRVGLGYETGTPDPNEDYYILPNAPQPTSAGTWTLY